MVTAASVVTPAVVVVAAVVTLVNVQEFKRRWLSAQPAREIARPVHRTYSPGLVALLGALGAGVTFLLAPGSRTWARRGSCSSPPWGSPSASPG
ncbi:hypothetical protein ACFWY5_34520 [Nonomuraea sp. NPDC059007]|uniref:hypothetical protein n=1 Tax=Nonomuraea sp. NPDC059007 TaxID=3346692 RepID=UPI0036B671AE